MYYSSSFVHGRHWQKWIGVAALGVRREKRIVLIIFEVIISKKNFCFVLEMKQPVLDDTRPVNYWWGSCPTCPTGSDAYVVECKKYKYDSIHILAV